MLKFFENAKKADLEKCMCVYEGGLKFQTLNFIMVDVSNLKINKRWNVERPNLRVTKIGNNNWKVKASNLIYIKGQIWELG